MRVTVLFFGVLKEFAGKASESIQLEEGASLRDLLAYYEVKIPRLKQSLPSIAMALNQEYVSTEASLRDGDEIALLPPVSGGVSDEAGEAHARQQAGGRRYASIVQTPINTQQILTALKCSEDGAAVVFEGVVRDQTRGRKTLYLDYEAYEEMALQQMDALAEKALDQFAIREVALVHRLGRLEIGEISVLIVVASAHRAAAFDACRWLIDTLKRTVPIWKKEYFEDGAVWADGEPFPPEIARANSAAPGSPVSKQASK